MKLGTALFLATAATLAHSAVIDPQAGGNKHRKHHYKQSKQGKGFAKLFAAAPLGTELDTKGWKVTCDSEQPGYECAKAIDGDNGTYWHTAYERANMPHQIVLDLGLVKNLNGLSALPRQDQNNHGMIAAHDVAVSQDNRNWEVVASGTWYDGDDDVRFANFETRAARYVRLRATSEINNNPWTSLSELKVYEAPAGPTAYNGNGKWGPTIDFPTVPVAAVVDPLSGTLLVWSSYTYDDFTNGPRNRVFTSIWDPVSNAVTAKMVDNTDHDMFCPGISIDGSGKMIVTGGNSASKTSIYDFDTKSWAPGPDMNVPRGYQSSATLSNGDVWTTGGSWSGGVFLKNAEVYDHKARKWTMQNGASVKPMLTNDKQGIYRSDNHPWLFGWANASVFQAGPSTAMNWFTTGGDGGVAPAGRREVRAVSDPDSMNGDATMFDAIAGKILTVGGSPSYQDSEATANAHIITIGDVGTAAQVQPAGKGMFSRRAFHSSVALPNGQVLVTGGQSYAVPFTDDNPALTPELYDPATDKFYQQQPNSIVRTYHSVALLLPDGRVFTGGGGLCGDCKTNHFDGQVFTPQYLLTADGKPATRPVIRTATQSGRRITITTDSDVKTASLMRYGTATHTVNTDQRRVPLKLVSTGTNQYTVDVPGDTGVVLPGYYMLFVMNANGVPSVSKTVQFLA
ncbi:hypothetical protein E4U42_004056 [Claviceps africana]|uniref:F5/8 type C domain-containing protein n=1 Tax=Claviceps africana TaxID=83212 RepID=A0A8K0NID6_9HYPO|nr:hypothetical protein E4U42_004056 [Claviceps africana]